MNKNIKMTKTHQKKKKKILTNIKLKNIKIKISSIYIQKNYIEKHFRKTLR